MAKRQLRATQTKVLKHGSTMNLMPKVQTVKLPEKPHYEEMETDSILKERVAYLRKQQQMKD